MPVPKSKARIDLLLVERGLVPTREKAAALILGGLVWVEGVRVEKAGSTVRTDAALELKGALPFVSRGGQKLSAALDAFAVSVENRIVLDVGASTGGFTDCLLQRGARRVYAVDVGYGQLDWKLRQDARVVNLEKTHIRELKWDRPEFQEYPVDMATLDLSFISLKKVLPIFYEHLTPGSLVVALIKPQFEVGKGEVGRGGVVRDPLKHKDVVDAISAFAASLGFEVKGTVPSVLPGQKGNVEFFSALVR